MGLGAVVAVEVGAAVGGADDHVRVVLGDPWCPRSTPASRCSRGTRRRGPRPAARSSMASVGCTPSSAAMSTSERPTNFSFSGFATSLTCSTSQCGGGSVGPGGGVAVRVARPSRGWRRGRPGRASRASALGDRRRLGEHAVELERALVELRAGGEVEGAVERLRHRHRVDGRALRRWPRRRSAWRCPTRRSGRRPSSGRRGPG